MNFGSGFGFSSRSYGGGGLAPLAKINAYAQNGDFTAWLHYGDTTALYQLATGKEPGPALGNGGTLGLAVGREGIADYDTLSELIAAGSELVTNGSFTGSATGWTLGADWSYSAGEAVATASDAILEQAGVVSVDDILWVQYVVANYSAGNVTPSVGTGS